MNSPIVNSPLGYSPNRGGPVQFTLFDCQSLTLNALVRVSQFVRKSLKCPPLSLSLSLSLYLSLYLFLSLSSFVTFVYDSSAVLRRRWSQKSTHLAVLDSWKYPNNYENLCRNVYYQEKGEAHGERYTVPSLNSIYGAWWEVFVLASYGQH